MAGMTPTSTSTFEKMGDDGLASVMNMSGERSPYTMEQPKHGPTSPDLGGENKGNRGSSMIHEAHGPQFQVVASRSFAPSYPETGRGLRTVPSSLGNRDFWAAREGSNEGEVIG